MYRELLEQEMKASAEFTKTNFGQQVGADFPTMVRDIAPSTELGISLLIGLCMSALGGKQVAESVQDSKKPDYEKMILDNTHVFMEPLSMLYWGIQIGRKLQKTEAEVSVLESMMKEKDAY